MESEISGCSSHINEWATRSAGFLRSLIVMEIYTCSLGFLSSRCRSLDPRCRNRQWHDLQTPLIIFHVLGSMQGTLWRMWIQATATIAQNGLEIRDGWDWCRWLDVDADWILPRPRRYQVSTLRIDTCLACLDANGRVTSSKLVGRLERSGQQI